MELRELRAFVAVAEHGTTSAAAVSLGQGQPAISRQLAQLERGLQVPLFRRERGRLQLTAAGLALLPLARSAMEQVETLATAAGQARAGQLGTLAIAATGTTVADVLAPWLSTWGAGLPLASVREAPAAELYALLARGIDLAVSPLPPPPEVCAQVVAALPLWCQVAPDHPWAGRSTVDLSELPQTDLLLLAPTLHARRRLDAALVEAGVHVRAAAEFTSPLAAQAVAASGRGACIVSDDPRYGVRGIAILDRGRTLQITLYAAWMPTHHASDTLATLAARLSAFTAHRYEASSAGTVGEPKSALEP